MEVVVATFAALVAAGCFVAILKTDMDESAKNKPVEDEAAASE